MKVYYIKQKALDALQKDISNNLKISIQFSLD